MPDVVVVDAVVEKKGHRHRGRHRRHYRHGRHHRPGVIGYLRCYQQRRRRQQRFCCNYVQRRGRRDVDDVQ